MKKYLRTVRLGRIFIGGGALVLLVSMMNISPVHAMITNYLDIGSRGEDVTELQTYLRANPNLYPSGLVTGYFGTLTEGGVEKFQVQQGIVSSGTPATTGYGRVGPATMSKLNQVMSGGSYTSGGMFGQAAISPLGEPLASSVSIDTSDHSATFSWVTNEPTQGQVYYDTNPLVIQEETGPYQSASINGSYSFDGGNRTNHSVTIENLRSDTTYYYLVRSVDASGNAVIMFPRNFRTNQ